MRSARESPRQVKPTKLAVCTRFATLHLTRHGIEFADAPDSRDSANGGPTLRNRACKARRMAQPTMRVYARLGVRRRRSARGMQPRATARAAKPRLYLESSIVGYLASASSRDIVRAGRQRITHQWWGDRREHFAIFVSDYVIQEAGAGIPASARLRLDLVSPFDVLTNTQEVEELASRLLSGSNLPSKAATDAAISQSRR